MFESIKIILALIGALVTIVAGVLTILRILRKKEIFLPNLRLSIPWMDWPQDLPKKSRKLKPSIVVIAPEKKLNNPIIYPLLLGLEVPAKGEAIKNVRIMLEYNQAYLIDNPMLEEIVQFEPSIIKTDLRAKEIKVMVPSMTKDEVKKHLEQREVAVIGDQAQVVYEIPLLRKGEKLVCQDFILLPGLKKPDPFQNHPGGFQNILKLMQKMRNLNDYFLVNIWIHAENHPEIKTSVAVLNLVRKTGYQESLRDFVTCLWFGEFPKPGRYFTGGFLNNWILKKLNYTGRLNSKITKVEMGIIYGFKNRQIRTMARRTFSLFPIEDTDCEIFTFETPNCDYYNLPSSVTNFSTMWSWLGLPKKPTFRAKQKAAELKGNEGNKRI
ncbi:MAG TPA: hypothetical protein VGB17_03450 [Pyrinomonadaceae bacterium]|jgi:hypothetical protein